MFVAHRLRTIYDSDRILVLKDGQVVESGTHSELLEMKGVYAKLWHGKLLFFFFFYFYFLCLICLNTDHAQAQELSLAKDVELESNLELDPESDIAEGVTATEQRQTRK